MAGGGLALAGAGASYAGLSAMGSIESYNAAMGATRAPLAPMPDALECIRYATLAASGHNAQPWRFRVGAEQIDILPDLARRTPIVDPDDHHLFCLLAVGNG